MGQFLPADGRYWARAACPAQWWAAFFPRLHDPGAPRSRLGGDQCGGLAMPVLLVVRRPVDYSMSWRGPPQFHLAAKGARALTMSGQRPWPPFDDGGSYGEAALQRASAAETSTAGLDSGSITTAAKKNGKKKQGGSLVQPSLKRNNGGGENGGPGAFR
jgi:hypothetical protein